MYTILPLKYTLRPERFRRITRIASDRIRIATPTLQSLVTEDATVEHLYAITASAVIRDVFWSSLSIAFNGDDSRLVRL